MRIGRLNEQPGHFAKTFFAEIDLRQWIIAVGIETGGNQEHLGLESINGRQHPAMERGDVIGVG